MHNMLSKLLLCLLISLILCLRVLQHQREVDKSAHQVTTYAVDQNRDKDCLIPQDGITYGDGNTNRLLDETLMNSLPFLSETLMELAGIACSQVANRILKGKRLGTDLQPQDQRIVVLIGPGDNGGDGLVAARHLAMMHYTVDLITFKALKGKNGKFLELCKLNGISVQSSTHYLEQNMKVSSGFSQHLRDKDLIIDTIFGYSLKGAIRQPYLNFLKELQPFQDIILSADVPSGWDSGKGNIHQLFTPGYLIEFGVPKEGNRGFKGEHYFGGRFVPESVKKQLGLRLPDFRDDDLYCRL